MRKEQERAEQQPDEGRQRGPEPFVITQAELIAKAAAGELACPRCGEPLQAQLTRPDEEADGVVLCCACGFTEV